MCDGSFVTASLFAWLAFGACSIALLVLSVWLPGGGDPIRIKAMTERAAQLLVASLYLTVLLGAIDVIC